MKGASGADLPHEMVTKLAQFGVLPQVVSPSSAASTATATAAVADGVSASMENDNPQSIQPPLEHDAADGVLHPPQNHASDLNVSNINTASGATASTAQAAGVSERTDATDAAYMKNKKTSEEGKPFDRKELFPVVITLGVRDVATGKEIHFKVKTTTRFAKVFNAYAERNGHDTDSLCFSIDGQLIDPAMCPSDIDVKDKDVIDCCQRSEWLSDQPAAFATTPTDGDPGKGDGGFKEDPKKSEEDKQAVATEAKRREQDRLEALQYVGKWVTVRGLERRPELNGSYAYVESGPKEGGHFVVGLARLDGLLLKVKKEKLELVDPIKGWAVEPLHPRELLRLRAQRQRKANADCEGTVGMKERRGKNVAPDDRDRSEDGGEDKVNCRGEASVDGESSAEAASDAPSVSTQPATPPDSLRKAVLADARVRREVAPALLSLYHEVHQVEGLDVDVDVGFDKYSVRHSMNQILIWLWTATDENTNAGVEMTPLSPNEREDEHGSVGVEASVSASASASTSTHDGDKDKSNGLNASDARDACDLHGADGDDATGGRTAAARESVEALVGGDGKAEDAKSDECNDRSNAATERAGSEEMGWSSVVFDEFVVAALDTITYTLLDAFERLADGYNMERMPTADLGQQGHDDSSTPNTAQICAAKKRDEALDGGGDVKGEDGQGQGAGEKEGGKGNGDGEGDGKQPAAGAADDGNAEANVMDTTKSAAEGSKQPAGVEPPAATSTAVAVSPAALDFTLARLPPPMSRERAFYENQRVITGHFIGIARSTLAVLNMFLDGSSLLASHTWRSSTLAPRMSALIRNILRKLVGAAGDKLCVIQPLSWNFDRMALMSDVCSLLASTPDAELFRAFLTDDDDFEPTLLRVASESSGGEMLLPLVDALLSEGTTTDAGTDGGTDSIDIGSVSVVRNLEAEAAKYEELCEEYSCAFEPLIGPASAKGSADAADADADAGADADAASTAGGGSRVGSGGARGHHFFTAKNKDATLQNPKAVATELRKLPKMVPDPHPDGSIFVVVDDDRINYARAAITGPSGTPYSGGFFVFDIMFPRAYPNEPPLLQLLTTGQGTVRFNPNLYADGKVCLSLLGTFNGRGVNEKWQPGISSLYQILMSIQGQILTADPYYNEPGRDMMRGTPAGAKASNRVNAELRLHTIRHAMVSALRSPPPGMEGCSRAHFTGLRHELLDPRIVQRVLDDAPDDLRPKLSRAYADLSHELASLTRSADKEKESAGRA